MKKRCCYIDNRICTGARFGFCPDCLKAQKVNAEKIKDAKNAAEYTAAHCLKKEDKKC